MASASKLLLNCLPLQHVLIIHEKARFWGIVMILNVKINKLPLLT
jgi:hypothetical protein